MKYAMRLVRFNKSPLLYGASFLLNVFGSGHVIHCRTLNINSDYGRTLSDGFKALGRDFAKVMSRDLQDERKF